jgi:hypothetical protein
MEVFATFFFIGVFLLTLILTPLFLRSKERMRLLELVRAGSERGEPMPPELVRTLMSQPKPYRPSHIRDMRLGIVLISFAIAVEIIAFCFYSAIRVDDPNDWNEAASVAIGIAGFGALPACIGLAFILLSLTAKKTAEV